MSEDARRALMVWSPELLRYDFGPGHPMSPLRLRLTHGLVEALGLLDDVDVLAPPVAADELLELVHDGEYVEQVRAGPARADERGRWGLGPPDNPPFEGMHEAAARIVGGTEAAMQAVWRGERRRAVNVAGGMHHAMPASAAGFCVYNDVAVGIASMLRSGARRVLYLDVDAHHGDGVERAFWDDPRVLTISVHQHGSTLFPGTGYPQDVGGGAGAGFAVNVALPPRTADAAWLRAIDAVAGPLARQWRPEVVVSQHGADAHGRDPLTDLDISVDAQRAAALWVADLAEEVAQGRWVATGGGGYDLVETVPRAWAHVVAAVAGRPVVVDAPTPRAWRDQVRDLVGREAPTTMGEGRPTGFRPWSQGYDPDDAVDRAVLGARRATFPDHGLDPLLD